MHVSQKGVFFYLLKNLEIWGLSQVATLLKVVAPDQRLGTTLLDKEGDKESNPMCACAEVSLQSTGLTPE